MLENGKYYGEKYMRVKGGVAIGNRKALTFEWRLGPKLCGE